MALDPSIASSQRWLKWRRRLKRFAIATTLLILLMFGAFVAAWFIFPFPLDRLDNQPISPVVTDRNGQLLLQCVGRDDQWRFPVALDQISPWLTRATLVTEDGRFREHCGVDAKAVGRAVWQDVSAWRKVSGASTLTMQVCRMMDDRPRTLLAKSIEAFRALQLERLRSKDEILTIYLNMAPYGRNIRGVEAASRFWFGKHARDLSLGEAALLAGVPQSPARYRLDRNPEAAKARRLTVLRQMLDRGLITPEQRDQAAGEPLALATGEIPKDAGTRGRGDAEIKNLSVAAGSCPFVFCQPLFDVCHGRLVRPCDTGGQAASGTRIHQFMGDKALATPIPQTSTSRSRSDLSNLRGSPAPHAAWLALSRRPLGGRTTIDANIQAAATRIAREQSSHWPAGADASIVIIDIPTGDIVAMVGSLNPADPVTGQVCGASAWRSPGSSLKPFVYAAAFEARRLAPTSTVYDICIQRAGWSPNNFDGRFAGPLPAEDALRRSLNVPAILVAEGVGLSRCVGLMRAAGVQLRDAPEARGGLATVVGAIEVRLLDLTNAYATLGRSGIRRTARLFPDEPADPVRVIDANACGAIDDILSSRARRPTGLEGLREDEVPWFMWKTGTSSGRRDAWAVGHNRRYAVGVWVGRFNGRGDPAFVGGDLAEPLAAQIFAMLGNSSGSAGPDLGNNVDPTAQANLVAQTPSAGWHGCVLLQPCLRGWAEHSCDTGKAGTVANTQSESVDQIQQCNPPALPPARSWTVTNPLPKPEELAGKEKVQITFPPQDGRFLAVGGPAIIHPRVNTTRTLHWFLNGRLLEPGEQARLLLGPGCYQLRCVAATGSASLVSFVVR